MARINGNGLSGGAAGQQAQENAEVLFLRDDLFQAHGGNLYLGQVRAHVGVALVGTHHVLAGFGYGEVHAREGGAAGHEYVTQVLAGYACELGGVRQTFFGTQMLVKQLADFFLALVNAR